MKGGESRNQIVTYFFQQHATKIDLDVSAFGLLRNLEQKGKQKQQHFPSLPLAWKHLVQCACDKGIAFDDEEEEEDD